MQKNTFTIHDVIVSFVSLFSYVIDVASDILLIVVFFTQGHQVWASVSLAFIALATFLMQVFSFHWHVKDKTMTWSVFFIHITFLAPFHRYVEVIRLGLRARRTQNQQDLIAVFKANNDICLLRLFESFTESAPQLVLQLYIILNCQKFNWVIGLCAVLSLASLAWSMTAYTHGLRLVYNDGYNTNWIGMTVLTAWQVAMVSSRVMAMVVFSTVYQAWVFLAVGIHWCMMTAWVTLQNAEFGETACEKRIFNSIVGFIYIFCFLNLKESRARWRILAYHIITVMENSLLILIWFLGKEAGTPVWFEISTIAVVFGGFICGGLFMVMYYCCCHPTGVKSLQNKENMEYWFKRLQNTQKTRRETIFDRSDISCGQMASWMNASFNLSVDGEQKSVSTNTKSFSNVSGVLNSQIQGQNRIYNNLTTLSTYRNYTDLSPTNTFDASEDGNNSFVTRKSGKLSYISNTNTKYLMDCDSNPSSSYIDHDHSHIATVSRSIGREDFNDSLHNHSSGNACVGIEVGKSYSSSLSNTSKRLFSVTNGLSESMLSCSYPSKSLTGHDSFYSSPEYKSMKLSPLNAKQLWDESQSRLTNNVTQSFTVVTHTDLDRLYSHSTVTWNKSEADQGVLPSAKSLCGEYEENHFSTSPTYLQSDQTNNDHNYAVSSTDTSFQLKMQENNLSPIEHFGESDVANHYSLTSTSHPSNFCYSIQSDLNSDYSQCNSSDQNISSRSSKNCSNSASIPQHSFNSSGVVFSDISQSYSYYKDRSYQSQNSRRKIFSSAAPFIFVAEEGLDSEDSRNYYKHYSDSGSSYVSSSQRVSDKSWSISESSLTQQSSSLSSAIEDMPYADEDVENQTGHISNSSEDLSDSGDLTSNSARIRKDVETALSGWFGDISSMHQSKSDESRFWISSMSGNMTASCGKKCEKLKTFELGTDPSKSCSALAKISDVSDTSFEPINNSDTSNKQNDESSADRNNSSISLYQYGNPSFQDEEERSDRDELQLKSSILTSGYFGSQQESNLAYGKKLDLHWTQPSESDNTYFLDSNSSTDSKSTDVSDSEHGCTVNISPILSNQAKDDSGYFISKSSSGRWESSDISDSQSNDTSKSSTTQPEEYTAHSHEYNSTASHHQYNTHTSDQIVPGGEILNKYNNKFDDNLITEEGTPVEISKFETSPNKLGRNVDLFKRSSHPAKLKQDKKKQANKKSQCKQDFQLSHLVESPYKFRSNKNVPLSELAASPYKFRSPKENLKISQLVESPYKFRSRKSEPLGYSQGHRSVKKNTKSCSNLIYDKENIFSHENCSSSMHRSNNALNFKPASHHQVDTGTWRFRQETDIDAFRSDSLDEKQHYVPSFKQKGLKRRTGQLDMPVTKFCYGYSSDESRVNDSDIVIPGFINTSITPEYTTLPWSKHSESAARLSASCSDLQRRAFQALENTPGFSPIIVPEELQRIQNCSGDRIVKPVVSTPRRINDYGGSYQQLTPFEEKESSVEV